MINSSLDVLILVLAVLLSLPIIFCLLCLAIATWLMIDDLIKSKLKKWKLSKWIKENKE